LLWARPMKAYPISATLTSRILPPDRGDDSLRSRAASSAYHG
jgi:hypothetical protein